MGAISTAQLMLLIGIYGIRNIEKFWKKNLFKELTLKIITLLDICSLLRDIMYVNHEGI
jgi:hypothetical protein